MSLDGLDRLGAVKLGAAVFVTYFLAARLGLALRAEGVAVFMPAAGIAIGALITLGPKARLPVCAGVIGATAAANFMFGKNIWLATAIGFVNAGDTLLTAWLIGRWFGSAFRLDDVRQVLGFMLASAAGAAIAAVGGAAAMSLVQSTLSPLNVWRIWFAACLLGTVTIAPLVIGLGEAVRVLPSRRELIDGAIGLATLALLSAFLIFLPEGPWESAIPVALVFPVLLWVTIRCRPVFAAAAALVVAIAIIWSTTSNVGHFGDASVPLANRILAAQTHGAAGALLALVLAALFAENRRSEAQFALAAKIARVGRFTFDIASGTMEVSPGYAAIHGLPEGTRESTRAEWRARVHPDDLPRLDTNLQRDIDAGRSEHDCEYRIIRAAGDTRWLEARSFISYDREGVAVGIIGVNIDVTERKKIELALAERNTQIALAGTAALVGSYVYEADLERMKVSEGYAAMHGLPERTTETTRSEWRTRVHPDDLAPLEALRTRSISDRRSEFDVDYRIIRASGEIRWIEARSFISYNPDGHPQRMVGVNIDVTKRKQTEQALAERNAQLTLAGRAALVGSYAFDVDTGKMQVSEGYAAIHGLPEGTTETWLSEWRARVHPGDLGRVEELRDRGYADRRKEDNAEYRIILPTGEVRWIERRGSISYGADGRPERVLGVNIDITGRKRAEEQQRTLHAELDHRVKNVLAIVSAIAANTRDASSSMDDFVAAIDRRIRSMASTHELLSSCQWQGVPLRELLRCELAPYASNTNICIEGPEVVLRAEAAQTTALVFHELATNAAKYGALSSPEGRVSVCWQRPRNGQALGPLVIEWLEVGGPPVKDPTNSGYGKSVITELVPYELGGRASLEFPREGVRCRLEIPAEWLALGEQKIGYAHRTHSEASDEAATGGNSG